MKTIFNKQFLSEIDKFGNTLKLTNYVIGTYHKKITSVNELFDNSYLIEDGNKLQIHKLNSIWEDENKLLKIYLDIPEEEKENLSTYNYCFIYCYYKIENSDDRIAFILSDGDIKNLNFNNLNLSINNNLIKVIFPKSTVANLNTNKGEDTKFLEGIGIEPGYNLFIDDIENSNNKLVTKESYYKYLRNKGYITVNDIDYLHVNVIGEAVCDKEYISRKINNITIYTGNSKKINQDDDIYYDNSLLSTGGFVRILGTYSYTDFKVFDGKYSLISRGEDNIINLINSEIKTVQYNGLDYTVDYQTKSIIYKELTEEGSLKYSDIKLFSNFYDSELNKVVQISSNTIRLSQSNGENSWKIIHNTRFSEEGSPVYLMSSEENDESYFDIYLNQDVLGASITLEYENMQIINRLFSIEEIDYSEENRIRMIIRTKTENDSPIDWLPVVDGNSKLIPINIYLNNTTNIGTFYIVQKPKNGLINVFIKNEIGEYEEVDNITLSEENKSVTLYPAKDNFIEAGFGTPWWMAENIDERLEVFPTYGSLNSFYMDEWGNDPKSFKITLNSIGDYKPIKPLQLDRKEALLSKNEWRDNLKVGTTKLSINFDPKNIILEVDKSNIIFDKIGLYKFNIKSNYPFEAKILLNNGLEKYFDFSFFDSDNSKLYSSGDNFNIYTGTTIYIRVDKLSRFGSNEINSLFSLGNIKIYPINLEEDKSVSLSIFEKLDKFEINKFIPTEDYIFANSFFNIKYKSNRSINFPTQLIDGIIEDSIVIENIFDKARIDNSDRGYLYTNLSFSIESTGKERYPAIYKGETKLEELIGGSANVDIQAKKLKYKLYQKGIPPEIELSNKDSVVYLGPEKNNYVDITYYSNYDLDKIESSFVNLNKQFNVTVSRTGNYVHLRIRALQNSSITFSEFIGKIIIKSEISNDIFLDDPSTIDKIFSQEEINNIAGYAEETIYVYQSGYKTEYDILGDTSSVSANGEERYFNVIGPNTGFSIRIVNLDHTLTNYSTLTKTIYTTIESIDKDYSPINMDIDKTYTEFSKDREVGFVASMTERSSILDKKIVFPQNGYKYGIVYKSGNTDKNILLLGKNSKNNILERVDYNVTSFKLGLGLFNITSILENGNKGISVNIVSDSDDCSYEYLSEFPIYNNYNLVISFPINNSFEVKTRTFDINIVDSNLETHSFSLSIAQDPIVYRVISNNPLGEIIRFHSSGHCMQYNLKDDLDLFDAELETNIPKQNFKMSTSSPDIEVNSQLIYLGEGSQFGYSKYRVLVNISPNKSNELRKEELYIDYVGEDGSIVSSIWRGEIRQGYLLTYLINSKGETISPGEVSGTIENPYLVPAKNSGENKKDRVIFTVKSIQNEINDKGELNSVNLDISPENIYLNSNTGFSPEWVSDSGNIETFFSSYSTIYNTTDDQIDSSKFPFIENTYITKEDYYGIEILFKISFNLRVIYEDIKENSDNYSFGLILKKKNLY